MNGTIDQITQAGIPIPWPLRDYAELPAIPPAVPSARLAVRQVLGKWELDGLAEDVELIVTELVTNVVVHGGPFLRLWLSSDGAQVFIQVWDASEALPELRDAKPEALDGRGLLLVGTLSKAWGAYRPVRSGGKVVWAIVGQT